MSNTISIQRGLDLPIPGQPEQRIDEGQTVSEVALIGLDYLGLKPKMAVSEGDKVSLGQTLFNDKRDPTVNFTAPGSGTVKAVHRGAKRVLQSVVIELDESGSEDALFEPHSDTALAALSNEAVREHLCQSGLWTALRTRPYSKVPASDSQAEAIFVTAMDSNPLAADADVIIAEHLGAFASGLQVLAKLISGPVHVCHGHGSQVAASLSQQPGNTDDADIRFTGFDGPHPSGLPGTHIHFLHPVSATRMVWHIGYQDVIAIGKLFTTGALWTERVVALGGPMVSNPRLLRTRLGANIDQLVHGELQDDREVRIISGSVLTGRRANNWASYLGRYHTQISIIAEGRQRDLFGWVDPRGKKFSFLNVFLSSFNRDKAEYDFHSSAHGSARAMVPIGSYERVVPLDMLPTQLLRAILVQDTDTAQKLGCMELDEEDIALCSYVCHGKYDFGPALRANLEQIEKEG